MNVFIRKMMGYYLQDEAAGGDAPAAVAGGVPAAPAPAPGPGPGPGPSEKPGSLLTDTTAATAAPDAAADADAKAAAPEAYSDFTFAEGLELDAEMLGEATAVFKQLGLTQEQAQGLVDLQNKMVMQGQEAMPGQLDAALAAQSERWVSEIKNDPEYGGEKFNATIEAASKAMQAFGSPELRGLLNDSGIGNHPEMVKLFHRIGSGMTEDQMVLTGTQLSAASNKEEDLTTMFYPKK